LFGLQFQFDPSDFITIATLVLLEGLLSADNALVLALLVRHLPEVQQQRALTYGFVGAFVLRAIGIAVASLLIQFWWVCGLGALYLIGMTVKHFLDKRHGGHDDEAGAAKRQGPSFWKTVSAVGFTDIVFAVDSILVAVALVDTAKHPGKLWIVYLGGLLGIVLLRLAAGVLVGLIRKYPALDNVAYALVGWAGVKLAATAGHLLSDSPLGKQYNIHLPGMSPWIFWPVFGLILLVGITTALRHKATEADLEEIEDEEEALEDLQEGGFVAGGARVYPSGPLARRAAPKNAPHAAAPAPPTGDSPVEDAPAASSSGGAPPRVPTAPHS